MAKLNFLLDGKLLNEFVLTKEKTTIGRRPTNDIHIDNLAVSGEHATILTLGSDSFLEDLNSTNGTMVNQKLIKKHVLQHNDVIEFGKYQLVFISDPQVKKPDGDGFISTTSVKPTSKSAAVPENFMAIKEQQPFTPVAQSGLEKTDTVLSGEVALRMGHIRVLNGANSGHELLLNKALVKLGKPGGQLALITKRPHGYFITHVEGGSYPLVNDKSIGVQAYALSDHDVIEISGIKMEFYFD